MRRNGIARYHAELSSYRSRFGEVQSHWPERLKCGGDSAGSPPTVAQSTRFLMQNALNVRTGAAEFAAYRVWSRRFCWQYCSSRDQGHGRGVTFKSSCYDPIAGLSSCALRVFVIGTAMETFLTLDLCLYLAPTNLYTTCLSAVSSHACEWPNLGSESMGAPPAVAWVSK